MLAVPVSSSRRVRQRRQAAGPAAITRASAECRLSIHIALGGTAASVRLVVAEASPDAICRTSTAACRRPVKAVSTHYMALGRAATGQSRAGWAPIPPATAPWAVRPDSSAPPVARTPVADHTLARLPRAAWYRFSACGVGTGVEPVTSRLTTWRSTTELPWLTRPSVRTHVRNTRRQPPHKRTEPRAPLARPYQKRRWELNPLEAALQAAAVPSGSGARSFSALAGNRTRSTTFAQSRARPAHSEDITVSAPPRNRTPSWRFVVCRALRYTRRASVSTRTRTWIWTFGLSYAILCTIETFRADDWIRTSIERFTRPPPFSVEPRRQAGARGFEPRGAALETASSPRRTLL